jgi:hypothetical protein
MLRHVLPGKEKSPTTISKHAHQAVSRDSSRMLQRHPHNQQYQMISRQLRLQSTKQQQLATCG